ncbi:MAG: DUF3472 domain-containing protein [Verrucomicrobiota bacterium]
MKRKRIKFATALPAVCASLGLLAGIARAELQVPAFTAYLDPIADGARVSAKAGISGWTNPALSVLWYGELKSTGELQCALSLRLAAGKLSKLRLTVAGQAHEATVNGQGDTVVQAKFGTVQIKQAGYQCFKLESLNAPGQPAGDLAALVLDGPAIRDAHFNLKPRRNAASVHLAYPVPKETKVAAFYCEMTGVEEPLWTYYEACGWHRGYFGMQINSATERRIIFSVWDSGGEAVDRKKVGDEDRVRLVAKGEGVSTGDFGNEGTGGHSHLTYLWKTGEKQRFIVTAKPVDATHTVFAGYYFHPDKKAWLLISSWKTPKDGGYLHGLYSFSENFGGSNGHLHRKVLYGNQWIRTAEGQWTEITEAKFSHDATGKEDRLDRFMGVENGQFFLSQGGFIPGFTKYGEKFTRPVTSQAPKDFGL